jgi:CRISPR-associated protein Csm5
MSKLHTRIGVTVELLSPLHIGTGTELLLDYDVVPHHDGRTYRVDEEALLEQALVAAEAKGAPAVNRLLAGRPAAELLADADFADPHSPLFRYVMPGMPFTRTPGAKVQEQIKDVRDRLYVPGSSLKGALRTVLAWSIYASQGQRPDLSKLKRSRSWASQSLEQELFGPSPNYDWLKALHVEDTEPLGPEGHLALRTVRIYPTETRDSPGLNVDLETVERGTVFQTAFTVDEYGFSEDVAQKLGWEGKRRWIERLPALAREHARQRLLTEAQYFKDRSGPTGALRFYDNLINTWSQLAENELIVQIGWGAGWESKTLGSGLLRQDDRAFERLLSQYRMTKERDRRPGDPFPQSRHLALRHGQPAEPLGWMRMRLEGLQEMQVARPEATEKPQQAAVSTDQETGRVARFFKQRGFGFIKPDAGGEDVFVHINDVTNADILSEGQRVAYDVEIGDKGPRAVNVRLRG